MAKQNLMEEDIRLHLKHKLMEAGVLSTAQNEDNVVNVVLPFVMSWVDMARNFSMSSEFYRDLLVKTGNMLGPEARRSDDGSMQQDVLVTKVPEMVEQLLRNHPEDISGVEWVESYKQWRDKL